MSAKDMLRTMLQEVIYVVGFVVVFALIALFIWDVGIAWLFPNSPNMNYGNALAISTGMVTGHMIINYYINRVLHLRYSNATIKSIEATILHNQKEEEKN